MEKKYNATGYIISEYELIAFILAFIVSILLIAIGILLINLSSIWLGFLK